jgi:hypothetical protein
MKVTSTKKIFYEKRGKEKPTNIVMASAVLSLFNSSSMELSDEKERVKFLDCTIGNNSSYHKKVNK